MIKHRFEKYTSDPDYVPDPLDYLGGDDIGEFDHLEDAERIEIAAAFVALHRIDNVVAWFGPDLPDTYDAAYLRVFDRMSGGDYGECRAIEYGMGEFEIEISRHDSADGYTHIFTF